MKYFEQRVAHWKKLLQEQDVRQVHGIHGRWITVPPGEEGAARDVLKKYDQSKWYQAPGDFEFLVDDSISDKVVREMMTAGVNVLRIQ